MGVHPGAYIVAHLINVPVSTAKSIYDSHVTGLSPLVLSGLFQHEHRVSVLHFQLKRDPSFLDPVKGKELMVFHCGFRRFSARPVYSQCDPRCDKQLVERFV